MVGFLSLFASIPWGLYRYSQDSLFLSQKTKQRRKMGNNSPLYGIDYKRNSCSGTGMLAGLFLGSAAADMLEKEIDQLTLGQDLCVATLRRMQRGGCTTPK